MSTADWIQSIAAILVFAALILNVLQLRQVTGQTEALRRSLEQAAYGSTWATHASSRTAYFLQDPELLAWHLSSRGYETSTAEENRRRLYALVKLESHEASYLSHANGLLSSEVWNAWRTVMMEDLSVPEFRSVWGVGKQFYAASFVRFIDSEILAASEPDSLEDSEPGGES